MRFLKCVAWGLMALVLVPVVLIGVVAGVVMAVCFGLITVTGEGMSQIEEELRDATTTEPIVSCVRGEMVSIYKHRGEG